MKYLTLLLIALTVLAAGCAPVSVAGTDLASQETQAQPEPEPVSGEPASRQAVLVELFTSEGCSSCPPADKALAFLDSQQPVAGAEIVTLAYHVDYWDDLGWKDEYSSADYSRRQEDYVRAFGIRSNYTPQMVVDGSAEFVGSNSGKAVQAIGAAAKTNKAAVELEPKDGKNAVSIQGLSEHGGATVFLAIAEDGLRSNVTRGENRGRELTHVSVVRELVELGHIQKGNNGGNFEFQPVIKNGWKKENLKYVVFVQEDETRHILGAAKMSATASPATLAKR